LVVTEILCPAGKVPNSSDESPNSPPITELDARNHVFVSATLSSNEVDADSDAMTFEALEVDVLVTRTVTGHELDGVTTQLDTGYSTASSVTAA
jgi:hypothetical protein